MAATGWNEPENVFNAIKSSFEQQGFVLTEAEKSIHDSSSIEFMTRVVGADEYTMKVTKEGLGTEFIIPPPDRYDLPNNRSAVENMPFIRKKVAEWEREGFVTKLEEKPRRLNPLTVASKLVPESGEMKKRLCIDMRVPNEYTDKTHMRFENLAVCQKILRKGDFQFVFDLRNMYFHVRLQDDLSQYFCFRLINANGDEEYYMYRVMGFGYSPAGRIVTRLVAPIKAFLHRLGIRFSIFIDDGRVCAESKIECEYKARVTLLVFQLAGWNIQWLKTTTDPSRVMKYQGFITDTVNMIHLMDQPKEERLLQDIDSILQRGAEPIPSRDLAGVVGKISSALLSHGEIVHVMTRSMQNQLGQAVGLDGNWDSVVLLDDHSRDELTFLKQNLGSFNGTFIRVHNSADEVYEVTRNREMIEKIRETDLPLDGLFVSDASDTKAFIYSDGEIAYVNDFDFSESERLLSSGQRELRAVWFSLSADAEKLKKMDMRTIYWQTDSRNCYTFLRRGSKLRHIQADVLKIKILEQKLGIRIVPVWTPRTHPRIVMADLGSKFHMSNDEWGLDRADLRLVFEAFEFEPTIDGFASGVNHVTGRFFSLIPQPGTTGVNFFAQKLSPDEDYFLCPPVNLITDTFHHFERAPADCKALVIVPQWSGSIFWPMVHDGKNYRPSIKSVMAFQAKTLAFNDRPSIFSRGMAINMMAFRIKT